MTMGSSLGKISTRQRFRSRFWVSLVFPDQRFKILQEDEAEGLESHLRIRASSLEQLWEWNVKIPSLDLPACSVDCGT